MGVKDKEAVRSFPSVQLSLTLGLQIAQNRPFLHTLGPKVGIIYVHGALGPQSRHYLCTWSPRVSLVRSP